jgi:hypothetical protein
MILVVQLGLVSFLLLQALEVEIPSNKGKPQ